MLLFIGTILLVPKLEDPNEKEPFLEDTSERCSTEEKLASEPLLDCLTTRPLCLGGFANADDELPNLSKTEKCCIS